MLLLTILKLDPLYIKPSHRLGGSNHEQTIYNDIF